MASSFMGVSIDPTTVKDGSLKAAFDPTTHPQTRGFGATVISGSAKVGSQLPATPVLATPVVASTGGTLPARTYHYAVAAVGVNGHEGVATATQPATTTGTTSTVTLTFTSPARETNGFKVYRDGLHLADVAHGVLTLIDTGAVAPAGAQPTHFAQEISAGESEGGNAPQPVDAGGSAAEGEGDAGSPTQAAL